MTHTPPLDEGAVAKVGFLQGKVTVGLGDGGEVWAQWAFAG